METSSKLQYIFETIQKSKPPSRIVFMIGFMHWNPKFDPHPTEDASNLEDMESLFQNCVVQGYIFI